MNERQQLQAARLDHLIARTAYRQGTGTAEAYRLALQALRMACMRAESALYWRKS